MTTVVEQPKPVQLEKITPVNIEKPLKYIEKVSFPIDGTKSGSAHILNSKPVEALKDLSDGYTSNTAQIKV